MPIYNIKLRGSWSFDFVHEAETAEVAKAQAKEFMEQEIAPLEVEFDQIEVTLDEDY